MVVHTCERCKKNFDKKSHYLDHIGRKYPCKQIIQAPKIIQEPINLFKTEENPVNINILEKNECMHCKKVYSNIYNLNKHLLICKVKLNNEINNKLANLEEKNKKMEEEINNLKDIKTNKKTTKIINNNNTINNNINIINLTDFDKPLNHQTIGKKIFFDSIANYSGLKPLLEFITYVHKNDNPKLLPYKNVKITDLGRNLGQIVKNNKWEVEDANDIVDKVVDDTYNYFEVQYETNEDEIDEKPANIKNKFKRFKKFYFCMRGPEFFEMNDDGDRVDDDGQLVTPNDFKNGKLFEVRLKKKAKMILKE